MGKHANYALAVALKQNLLQGLVRIYYHAGKLPHSIKYNSGGLAVDLFLDIPKVVCSSKNSNYLALTLTGWGSFSYSTLISRDVLVTSSLLVKPVCSLANASLSFSVDGAKAKLDSYTITPISGDQFTAAIQALLSTSLVKSTIEKALQTKLASISEFAPSIDLSSLGSIVSDLPNMTITAQVLDKVLALGMDVDSDGIKTTGDPTLLTDITDGQDIGIWQNPVALPIIMKSQKKEIEDQVKKQGATLDSFDVTLEDGYYHLEGSASMAFGSASFSANAYPYLVRPGYEVDLGEDEYGPCILSVPDREELWFDMRDKKVSINKAGWAAFLEILTGAISVGLSASIIEGYVGMAENNSYSALTNQSNKNRADRNNDFTFPDATDVPMRLRIEEYECHSEGTFISFTLRGRFPKPSLNGDTTCNIEEVLTDTPTYTLALPFDVQQDDPQLMIRWTVRRCDTNEVILQEEDTVENYLIEDKETKKKIPTLSLSSLSKTMLKISKFTIECRLYRLLGATATDYFNDSLLLCITDRLDRSHPYVRWNHWVFTPSVKVEANKTHTISGYKVAHRNSVIHRTDYPGRCKMVSKYSLDYPLPPRSPYGHSVPDPLDPEPKIEYMDKLPFTKADIIKYRSKVCDYCFFGGPDKDTPSFP
jgi:hypothetical protein